MIYLKKSSTQAIPADIELMENMYHHTLIYSIAGGVESELID
jgi:hypothetical protein